MSILEGIDEIKYIQRHVYYLKVQMNTLQIFLYVKDYCSNK